MEHIRAFKPFYFLIGAVILVLTLSGVGAQDGSATLQLAESANLDSFLVDQAGMSLYIFLADEQGDSTCYDACETAWPPFVVDSDPAYGEHVDAELVGVTERVGGALQVTYGSWPLYYFAGDANAADTNGHGMGGTWFLIDVKGEPLGVAEGSESTDEGGQVDLAELMSVGDPVFARHCSRCHGRQGGGGEGPPLIGERAVGNVPRTVRQILGGGHFMPAFGNVLTDTEVASVVTFIRNSWGNELGAVSEEEVSELR